MISGNGNNMENNLPVCVHKSHEDTGVQSFNVDEKPDLESGTDLDTDTKPNTKVESRIRLEEDGFELKKETEETSSSTKTTDRETLSRGKRRRSVVIQNFLRTRSIVYFVLGVAFFGLSYFLCVMAEKLQLHNSSNTHRGIAFLCGMALTEICYEMFKFCRLDCHALSGSPAVYLPTKKKIDAVIGAIVKLVMRVFCCQVMPVESSFLPNNETNNEQENEGNEVYPECGLLPVEDGIVSDMENQENLIIPTEPNVSDANNSITTTTSVETTRVEQNEEKKTIFRNRSAVYFIFSAILFGLLYTLLAMIEKMRLKELSSWKTGLATSFCGLLSKLCYEIFNYTLLNCQSTPESFENCTTTKKWVDVVIGAAVEFFVWFLFPVTANQTQTSNNEADNNKNHGENEFQCDDDLHRANEKNPVVMEMEEIENGLLPIEDEGVDVVQENQWSANTKNEPNVKDTNNCNGSNKSEKDDESEDGEKQNEETKTIIRIRSILCSICCVVSLGMAYFLYVKIKNMRLQKRSHWKTGLATFFFRLNSKFGFEIMKIVILDCLKPFGSSENPTPMKKWVNEFVAKLMRFIGSLGTQPSIQTP